MRCTVLLQLIANKFTGFSSYQQNEISKIKPLKIKSANKTKNLASCSRCGYKVELNISYARDTEKAKIKCNNV